MAGVEANALRPGSDEERLVLALLDQATARGRLLLIADASANATSKAVALCRRAQLSGADGVLISAPWYNRPSQEGIYRHFQAITEAADLPVLIGNAPDRAAVDLSETTLARLADLPGVVGLVEASCDVVRVSAARRQCVEGFVVLAGCDLAAPGFLAHGAQGLVSLTANVAPEAVVALCRALDIGDRATALKQQDDLFELHRALAFDPAPATTKRALSILGLCEPDVRLPMTRCSDTFADLIPTALGNLGLGLKRDHSLVV